MPAHAINTIFERSTNRTVVLRADAHVSNRRRSMAVSITCAATGIRRPPFSDAGSVPVHAMLLNRLFATLH